jgi:hypothetical protein
MKNRRKIILISVLAVLYGCSRTERTLVPADYLYPQQQIGKGKKYVYRKNNSSEISLSLLRSIQEENKLYRTVVNFEGDIQVDSSKYTDNGELVELYAFYMSGDQSKTKARIALDTIVTNENKEKERRTRLIYETDFNTYFINSQMITAADTSILWKGKPVLCKVVNNKTETLMVPKSGVDSSRRYRYNSYGSTYYGKGIGIIRYTLQSKDNNDGWDLRDIRDLN